MAKLNANEIKGYLVRAIHQTGKSPVSRAADFFGVTRATANRYLAELVNEGTIRVEGLGTRNRRYHLAPPEIIEQEFSIDPSVREEEVWRHFQNLLKGSEGSERQLCFYGLTEIVNNAIDHSGGTTMRVSMTKTPGFVEILVSDNGIGIFNKIAQALQLEHVEQSLLELSKGKFTTDETKHSGEGIFFTSRMFDHFIILSGNLLFSHITQETSSEAPGRTFIGSSSDWLWDLEETSFRGTQVQMRLNLPSKRTPEEVYSQYRTDEIDSGFSRTIIPLNLAKIGDEFLVSRSQARRVLARANRFKEVIFDFAKVESIGQAFADEIFRVFVTEHPEVHISVVGANMNVLRMIRHAENRS